MIILDTNVISEAWKASPDVNVISRIDKQAINTLCLAAITVAELRFGLGSDWKTTF